MAANTLSLSAGLSIGCTADYSQKNDGWPKTA